MSKKYLLIVIFNCFVILIISFISFLTVQKNSQEYFYQNFLKKCNDIGKKEIKKEYDNQIIHSKYYLDEIFEQVLKECTKE